jgi:hypothetical protein
VMIVARDVNGRIPPVQISAHTSVVFFRSAKSVVTAVPLGRKSTCNRQAIRIKELGNKEVTRSISGYGSIEQEPVSLYILLLLSICFNYETEHVAARRADVNGNMSYLLS